MHEKLNDNFILKNCGHSNYEATTNLPRHRWYYYKEGFSPTLVETAIAQTGLVKDDLIIDPFNGSGTTTLTASLLGYKSTGIEVNPFTSFLSDAKIKNAEISQLNRLENKLLKSAEKGKRSPLLEFSTFSETEKLDKWLFNSSVLNSFEGGWHHTSSISETNARKLVRLALISAAMQNCNAKRDGKCLRYRDWQEKKTFDRDSFIDSLKLNLSNIKTDIQKKPIHVKATIIKGDCRNILKTPNTLKNFKLCVTSPPYLNSFDYSDIYRPELFLGRFVASNKDLMKLRLKTLRSHIQANWKKPKNDKFGIIYNDCIDEIKANNNVLWSQRIPIMIQAYFEDMDVILRRLRLKAHKNASIWLIVSTSAYAGIEVPVDLILAEIGQRAGWFLREIGVLRYLRSSSQHVKHVEVEERKSVPLRESVVIFNASKNLAK